MGNALVAPGTAEKQKEESIETNYGAVALAMYSLKMTAESRTFAVAVPDHLTSEHRCSCVFFAHGVGGTAWYGAKEDTSWISLAAKEHSLVVVFLQSKGLFFDEKRKNSAGKYVWAASSWDYVYSSGDLQYVESVYDAVVFRLFPGIVEKSKVYFCGFDSGGMFAWPVATAFGGSKFAAVFSYNGGIDEHYLCDRKSMLHPISSSRTPSTDPKRCPVWICCGDAYEQKNRAENAVKVYKELGWPVRFDSIKGGAEWPKSLEDSVYSWFQIARDEALANHLREN